MFLSGNPKKWRWSFYINFDTKHKEKVEGYAKTKEIALDMALKELSKWFDVDGVDCNSCQIFIMKSYPMDFNV